jgi:two-component system, cell cycle sensor histidine kinase and response regulator CckA
MERRALYKAVAVFAGVLTIGAVAVGYERRLDVAERRRAATDLARGSAFAVEREFARALAAASTLGAMVAAGASDAQLDGVAGRMLRLNGGAAILQLAPGDVIGRIWPLAGNEAALGLDLLRHPLHGHQVRALRERREPLLYGPFQLVQGGAGFALRVPVLVADGAGAERYWGLASALVLLRTLLDESRITGLVEAGFDYELSRPAADGPRRELLASSVAGGAAIAQPVSVALELPGQTWTLAVAPREGWSAASAPGALLVAAVLVALLAAVLAYRVSTLPEMLRREVAARTAELEIAHREQRRAEEAQRQSQKLEAVGLLAGGVAHDFNNLLVGILGYADLLAADAAPGSVAEEAGRTISQAARRAAELTKQLLAFARLGNHRREPVDLHAGVEEVIALLARTLDKSIRIERRLGAARHAVLGDPGQLQQVILNLAVNARDAMPAGGTLTVETAVQEGEDASGARGLPRGRCLVLSVTDTGVGIPREHLERVFEPFFTTKTEGHGTGLGLATVYGIVKGHGGAVRVYSEERIGTRFTVYLPLLEGDARSAAAPAPALPRGAGRVLVVDDEDVVRRTAARMLRTLGFVPVTVGGGQEALDWLAAQAEPPAAVLLDLAMPGMDGATCFREMRARHPELRVVISSGFARNGRAQELLDEGADEFVQKPYDTAELARALSAAVEGAAR